MFKRLKRHVLPLVCVCSLVLIGFGIYVFVPSIRLALHSTTIAQIGSARRVNPHIYDAEWFDAARAGRVDILKALYDAKYPIDAKTAAGYTAVILTAYDEQPEALHYLLQAGADPCLADKNGNTALMGTLYKGEMPLAFELAQASCAIDQTNNAGETALAFAALFGRVDIIPFLVAHGADLNHRDRHGHTALAVAKEQGNTSVITALKAISALRPTISSSASVALRQRDGQ